MNLHIKGVVDLFGTRLLPGESIELETMAIYGSDTLWEMLEEYADLIRQKNSVKSREFEGIGWCSWYHYFTEITFEELLKNVRLLAEIRDREKIDYRLVQLDDGYQEDIGDWLQTNSKLGIEGNRIGNQGRRVQGRTLIAPFSLLRLPDCSTNTEIGL